MKVSGTQDEQRIDEIRRSFDEKGWRFFVDEEPASAVAWFFHHELGPSTDDVVRRPTPLEAARAAWDKFTADRPSSAPSSTRRNRQGRPAASPSRAYKAQSTAKVRRAAG